MEVRAAWRGLSSFEPDCSRHGQLPRPGLGHPGAGHSLAGGRHLREKRTLVLENEMLGFKSTPSHSSVCWTSDYSFMSRVRKDMT